MTEMITPRKFRVSTELRGDPPNHLEMMLWLRLSSLGTWLRIGLEGSYVAMRPGTFIFPRLGILF